jgi:hypothetical protein
LELDPTHVGARSVKLDLLNSTGRWGEAIALAEQYRQEFPNVCDFSFAQGRAHLRLNDLTRAKRSVNAALECAAPDSELRAVYDPLAALIASAAGDDALLAAVVNRYREMRDFDHDGFLMVCALSGDAELTANRIRASARHSNYRWLVTTSLPASMIQTPPIQALAAELYREWELDLAALGPEALSPPSLPSPEQWIAGP